MNALILVAGALAFASGAVPSLPRDLLSQSPVIKAAVNGRPIFLDEVTTAAYPRLMAIQNLPEQEREARRREILRQELDKLIERELLINEAERRLANRPKVYQRLQDAASKEFQRLVNLYKDRAKVLGLDIDTDERFEEMLKSQGMSLTSMRRMAERSFLAMEYMRHKIGWYEPGREAIREYYEAHRGDFPEQPVGTLEPETEQAIKARLVAIRKEAEFNRIMSELRKAATIRIMDEP